MQGKLIKIPGGKKSGISCFKKKLIFEVVWHSLREVLRCQRGRTAVIHFPFGKGRIVFWKWMEQRFVEKIDSHQQWLKRKALSKENPPDERRNVYIRRV